MLNSIMNALDVLLTVDSAVKSTLASVNKVKFTMLKPISAKNKFTQKKLPNMKIIQKHKLLIMMTIKLMMLIIMVTVNQMKYILMVDVYVKKDSLNMMDITVLKIVLIMVIGKQLKTLVYAILV